MCLPIHSCALAHTYTHTHTHKHTHTQCDVSTHRSWDEKQRERARLSRLAMLERDNHHTDNTHMMKVQNLAEDEIVGGGCLFTIYIQSTFKYASNCMHSRVYATSYTWYVRALYINMCTLSLRTASTQKLHKYTRVARETRNDIAQLSSTNA